jgi:hypothetical protein
MTSRDDTVVTAGKMKTVRDPFVDWFKGIMILSVINIHTVYWSGYSYIPEGVRQAALLVDVPIFFFISGYVTRPGSFFFCLLKTIRQFIRLYLHYLLISFLLLFALFLVTIMLSGWEHTDLGPAAVSVFGLSPHGVLWDSIWGYNGSLWYVRDYFSLLVFVPFLVGISSLYKIKFNVLVFVLLFTALFPKEYADHRFLFSNYGDISFYLFFFVLGVVFRGQEDHFDSRELLLSLLLTICLAMVVFYSDNGVLFTDRYKFPPATQYLIYSLPLVHVFALLKKKFSQSSFAFAGRCSLLLRWCGINIYYVYLFQGAVCSLAFFFVKSLVPVFHPAILYGLILVFNIFLSLTVSYLYVKVKDIVTSMGILTFRPEINK